jgi:hypothetical protein
MADAVIERLSFYFQRNGYLRRQNAVRRKCEGHRLYKKGDEIRLIANSARELREIRRLLREAGFKLARSFANGHQFRQPLYGVAEVGRFLSLLGEPPARPAPRKTRPASRGKPRAGAKAVRRRRNG